MAEISIIVPVYNKIRYLSAMLDSVINQSFSDFEVILIDDGSADGSERIADEYAVKDSRVQVYHIKNGGVSHARNIGLDVAKGEYITFIDSDDTVAEDYLETMYGIIEENNIQIVVGGIDKTWLNKSKAETILPLYTGRKEMIDIIDEFASVQKKTGIYGYCAAKLFSREIVGCERFDESLVLAEDFDFYLRIYRKVQSIFFTDYVGYYYTQEVDNSPMNVSDNEVDYFSQLLIQERFAEFLKEKNAYNMENKSIVDKNLRDYMFLTIYYAPKENFDLIFEDVYSEYSKMKIPMSGSNFRQKILLTLLKRNYRQLAKVSVMALRNIMRIVRR